MLRSDIRHTTSVIRYASFVANKISRKPQAFISLSLATISLRRSRNITLAFSADLCYNELSEKPPSEREGDRVSGGRSLRDLEFRLTL